MPRDSFFSKATLGEYKANVKDYMCLWGIIGTKRT